MRPIAFLAVVVALIVSFAWVKRYGMPAIEFMDPAVNVERRE